MEWNGERYITVNVVFSTVNAVKYYLSVRRNKAEKTGDKVYALREAIPGGIDYNLENLPQQQPRNTAYRDISIIHSQTTAAHIIKLEEPNHFTSNKESIASYTCSIQEFPYKALNFYVQCVPHLCTLRTFITCNKHYSQIYNNK